LLETWPEARRRQDQEPGRSFLARRLSYVERKQRDNPCYAECMARCGQGQRQGLGSLPLHYSCYSTAPLEALQCLLQAWPDSVKVEDKKVACFFASRVPAECKARSHSIYSRGVARLTNGQEQEFRTSLEHLMSVEERHGGNSIVGRTQVLRCILRALLVHLRARLNTWSIFIPMLPPKLMHDGMLPLHCACRREEIGLQFIPLLVHMYPAAGRTLSKTGDLLLH
jgi:hypothetical protein